MARFLLIGLDGAEPSLVEAGMAEGRLPNLAALERAGCFLPLASTTPPATFPAWTSCVTGVNPGRHGIFDFTEMTPGAYGVRFVNSTDRRAPALWNILTEFGRRVGVLGVPATYPPERVNGFMVAGFDSPVATRVARTSVYPESLFDEVRGWRFADMQESHIGPGWHAVALERLLAKIEDKRAIAERLLRREPWDFFMVVFGESDTVAHHFWLFHDPGSPRHQPGFEDAVWQVYERLDSTVGALIEAAGADATVAVVSDHGFGGTGTGVVHLNNRLAENGHLRFGVPPGELVKRAALRLTPTAWRGALFRHFHGLATRTESHSRFAGIDWAHTRAFSEELNYFPSVRINLRGREPQGIVAGDEYEQYVAQLCAELEAWPPVQRAWPRRQVYSGPWVERAPDIVIELALEEGYSPVCLRRRGGPSFRRIESGEVFGGKERGMAGAHRSPGILLLSKASSAMFARLEDVAPTVLAELGVPAPPMEGVSLLDEVETRAELAEAGQDPPPSAPHVYTREEEHIIEQRLRDLGYFE